MSAAVQELSWSEIRGALGKKGSIFIRLNRLRTGQAELLISENVGRCFRHMDFWAAGILCCYCIHMHDVAPEDAVETVSANNAEAEDPKGVIL